MVETNMEIDLSDVPHDDLMWELEERGFIVLPAKEDLTELLTEWFKRPLPDQIELADWLRNYRR